MSSFNPSIFDVVKLAKAFRDIRGAMSEKQLEDLQQLYERTKGIPFSFDKMNRPQGPTIRSCSSIGKRLTENIGMGPLYAMNWIGYSNREADTWNMRDNVRDAIKQLGWFGSGSTSRVSLNEEITSDESWSKEELQLSAKPLGNKTPTASTSNVTIYNRDPAVKAWVLHQANGTCECCGNAAPFISADGLPYLEVHHVRQLADHGTDTIANTVAACSNCHSELHYGLNSKALVAVLYERIPRLIRE